MTVDIVNLLNSAACGDPKVMLPASQQLTMLTEMKENYSEVCSAIAACVFSCDNHLSADGRFIGLIHLKNIIIDCKVWPNVDISVKKDLEGLLFGYISRGVEQTNLSNSTENSPRSGAIIAELVASFVRNEWMKNDWSDSFWHRLVDWHAWSSLRSGLKAAGSFRLPWRRRAFNSLVRDLLPNIIESFRIALESPERNIDPGIKLARLLYSCFTLIDYNSCMSSENTDKLFKAALTVSIQSLNLAFQDLPSKGESPLISVFRRRVSKLLFSVFLSASPEVRDVFVESVLEHILFIVSCPTGTKISYKDRHAVKWLLAVTYNVLLSKSSEHRGHIALTEQGKHKLELWMSESCLSNNGQVNNKLSYFVMSLFEHWFLFTPKEFQLLTSDPEACLASGGITNTSASKEVEDVEEYVSLNSFWNVDCQTNELWRCNIQTLMGISDNSQHMLNAEPCRQLAELIFTVYSRFYEDLNPLLYQIIQGVNAGTDKPFIYEAVMRLTQLCLPYFGTKENWINLTKHLITEGLAIGNSIQNNLGSHPIEDEIPPVVILTRTLCLLSRYGIMCIPSNDMESSSLKSRCNDALLHLNQFLRRPNNWGQEISRNQIILCIRLAAVYGVAWLLQEPVLPEDILAIHAESLLNDTLVLIQDVRECETRIYLLTVLRNIIQRIDLISFPQLTSPILSTLDHLWSLSGQSAALRANILDTVCLLVTELNASNENLSLLPEFNTLLRNPVISLIQMSLDNVTENRLAGSEALFEPGLRLWVSLVEGNGSIWSSDLVNLMPLLVGDSIRLIQSSGDMSLDRSLRQPLLARVDSGEQVDLVFRIAYGTLRLAHKAGCDTLHNFVSQWSEAFWMSILMVSLNWGSCEQVNLEDLYSQAACVGDDNRSDEESKYRLNQLKLFILWFTVYLDIECLKQSTVAAATTTTAALLSSPSGIGLLILAARYCLIRAPQNAHDDVTPKATELRLVLLARLVLYPNMWLYFMNILQLIHKYTDENCFHSIPLLLQECNALINQHCSISSLPELRSLLTAPLTRWLGRVDSLSTYIDRRCIAIACIICLRQGVQQYTLNEIQLNDSKFLEELAVNDSWHAEWLERVINIIIQVLYDEDELTIQDENIQFYYVYPIDIATKNNLIHRIRNELTLWQNQLGNPVLADALIKCHVDPALRVQLESQLNQ
ncbi:unnamed protein product [Trichobilharzia szidati]|nr:unnamed protein product [Trichobilharzia szidati]